MQPFNWSVYTGNLAWLPRRTIFMCRSGSMAYGTNGPDSDVDMKGVFIAPKQYYLGYLERIQQVDKNWTVDATSYDLRRLFELTIDCNPNMIEVLYTDPSDWLLTTPAWERVYESRHLVLSQNAKHRFCGYAISQLKRIETHRRWLLSPPSHKPERAEYGLPDQSVIPKEQREALEAMMLKLIEEWQVDYACIDDATRIDLLNKQAAALADMKLSADDQYVAAGNKLGLDMEAMELLKNERAYRSKLAEWTQYQTWLRERNPTRAALEAKYGYDTKHGMHLVRLMRMAWEILALGEVNVRRLDAEELKSIRFHGSWSYDRLVGYARGMDAELTGLMKMAVVPKQPKRQAVDDLCVGLVEQYLNDDPNQ